MFDYDGYLADFASAATQIGFTKETIAHIDGDPIDVWTRAAQTAQPAQPTQPTNRPARLILSAGIHGDEPAGPAALLRFLQEGKYLSHEIDWVLMPALNPSGLRLGTRENADGIDLNRDFLRGDTTEVAAVIRWHKAQATPPDAHFSLHEDWEAKGFYMYAINTGRYPCYATELVTRLCSRFRLQAVGPVDGHELTRTGLIGHEAAPDEPENWPEAIWIVKNFPTLSYTFEAPGGFTPQARVHALHIALEMAVRMFTELASAAIPADAPAAATPAAAPAATEKN